ncbi:hypothetical protein HDU98_007105 [Podochytrium sp. JEL0797]|nr:hypothetical protein HDU98_007105 [Podochytrium sp. JEL0797]
MLPISEAVSTKLIEASTESRLAVIPSTSRLSTLIATPVASSKASDATTTVAATVTADSSAKKIASTTPSPSSVAIIPSMSQLTTSFILPLSADVSTKISDAAKSATTEPTVTSAKSSLAVTTTAPQPTTSFAPTRASSEAFDTATTASASLTVDSPVSSTKRASPSTFADAAKTTAASPLDMSPAVRAVISTFSTLPDCLRNCVFDYLHAKSLTEQSVHSLCTQLVANTLVGSVTPCVLNNMNSCTGGPAVLTGGFEIFTKTLTPECKAVVDQAPVSVATSTHSSIKPVMQSTEIIRSSTSTPRAVHLATTTDSVAPTTTSRNVVSSASSLLQLTVIATTSSDASAFVTTESSVASARSSLAVTTTATQLTTSFAPTFASSKAFDTTMAGSTPHSVPVTASIQSLATPLPPSSSLQPTSASAFSKAKLITSLEAAPRRSSEHVHITSAARPVSQSTNAPHFVEAPSTSTIDRIGATTSTKNALGSVSVATTSVPLVSTELESKASSPSVHPSSLPTVTAHEASSALSTSTVGNGFTTAADITPVSDSHHATEISTGSVLAAPSIGPIVAPSADAKFSTTSEVPRAKATSDFRVSSSDAQSSSHRSDVTVTLSATFVPLSSEVQSPTPDAPHTRATPTASDLQTSHRVSPSRAASGLAIPEKTIADHHATERTASEVAVPLETRASKPAAELTQAPGESTESADARVSEIKHAAVLTDAIHASVTSGPLAAPGFNTMTVSPTPISINIDVSDARAITSFFGGIIFVVALL